MVEPPGVLHRLPGIGGAPPRGVSGRQGRANGRTQVVSGAARREGVLPTPLHIGRALRSGALVSAVVPQSEAKGGGSAVIVLPELLCLS